jgi:ABC-type lipoprotein release transport system permease subunit
MRYHAQAQSSGLRGTLIIRTAGRPEALLDALHAAVERVDPTLTYTPALFSSQIRESFYVERGVAALCVVLGALALLLAAIGLYGVLAYTVARRRGEIGLRMALGATPALIRGWVFRKLAPTVLIGAAVGVGLSIWATRFARTLLYGVQADDPRVYAGGVAVLLVVAALAAWWPARRAARVDPLASLRCE